MVTPELIEKTYISLSDVAAECGVDYNTVHNWSTYHRYMNKLKIVGRPVVLRSDFERFKREHPELIKTPQEAAAQ